MKRNKNDTHTFPPIPNKKYFTISEVSLLCGVKAYVLRYWEQEFPKLRPTKRRGNRRYYQASDILLIRQIKTLLYQEGFTIEGARLKLNKPEVKASPDSAQVLQQIVVELEQVVRYLRQETNELSPIPS